MRTSNTTQKQINQKQHINRRVYKPALNYRIACQVCGLQFPVKALRIKPLIRCPSCNAAYREKVQTLDSGKPWLLVPIFILMFVFGPDVIDWLSLFIGKTPAVVCMALVVGSGYWWAFARWAPITEPKFEHVDSKDVLDAYEAKPMTLKAQLLILGIVGLLTALAIFAANIPRPSL